MLNMIPVIPAPNSAADLDSNPKTDRLESIQTRLQAHFPHHVHLLANKSRLVGSEPGVRSSVPITTTNAVR